LIDRAIRIMGERKRTAFVLEKAQRTAAELLFARTRRIFAGERRKQGIFLMLFWLALTTAGIARAESSAPEHKSLTNSIGMEFVLIPKGTFMMGAGDFEDYFSDKEKPRHQVRISKPFYLGKYEVTQAQWETVMGNNPSRFAGGDRPVETVSWDDAQEFIARLNRREGHSRYRLPTEAEWEYAARAGSAARYIAGNAAERLRTCAWYSFNANGSTSPVGRKKPNAWGLHDMAGNVLEWVNDRYDANYYRKSPDLDPKGPESGANRCARGGSWSSDAWHCRLAGRSNFAPSTRRSGIGFRLALCLE
jgi:formylglycine-generating enzyme required for sulfatase activity